MDLRSEHQPRSGRTLRRIAEQCLKRQVSLAVTFRDPQPDLRLRLTLPAVVEIQAPLIQRRERHWNSPHLVAIVVPRQRCLETNLSLLGKLPAELTTKLEEVRAVVVCLMQVIDRSAPNESRVVALKQSNGCEALKAASRFAETLEDLHRVVGVVHRRPNLQAESQLFHERNSHVR